MAQGWHVSGTGRKQGDFLLDFANPLDDTGITELKQATHVLVSIPPEEEGMDPVLRFHGADLASSPNLQWVGYLSTTGVYGDSGGEWVDETTPPNPTQSRSIRRLQAETLWQEWGKAAGIPVDIFRLAGIYGPGRNVLEQIRAGTAQRVDKPGQYFSRIHVEDIARVLLAAMEKPAGEIYNLCDDEPAPSHEVVAYGCWLLGVSPPPLVPFEEAQLSEMAKSFYAGNRRVRNGKIKEKLGVSLLYPTYREGLAQLLNGKR